MNTLDRPPIIGELERAFGLISEKIFNGAIQTPTFAIQLDKKVVFRFVPESYHMVVGSKFADASLDEIAEHLLHEAIHINNHRLGVVDYTSNQYHNKRFLDAALAVGFHVVRHKTQGWSITTFTPQKGCYNPEPEALVRREQVCYELNLNKTIVRSVQKWMKERARTPRKVCFLKYVCACPPPHNSIRSGRRPNGDHPLDIVCNVCRSPFRLVQGQIQKAGT